MSYVKTTLIVLALDIEPGGCISGVGCGHIAYTITHWDSYAPPNKKHILGFHNCKGFRDPMKSHIRRIVSHNIC
jgi:hypothetical protein